MWQTNPGTTKLLHGRSCQKPGSKNRSNKRLRKHPPGLVSTHPSSRTTTNTCLRTHRTSTILSRLRRCIQMGSRWSLVQRHNDRRPDRMVLRVAARNTRPVLLVIQQKRATHDIRFRTNRNTHALACSRAQRGPNYTPGRQRLNLVRQPPGSSVDVQIQNEHIIGRSTNPPSHGGTPAHQQNSITLSGTHLRHLQQYGRLCIPQT